MKLTHAETDQVADVLDRAADIAHATPAPANADDQTRLIESADHAADEMRTLAARLRSAAGLVCGEQSCDAPPDLAGACQRCGRRLAGPTADHNPGCLALPTRVAVRAVRLARTVREELAR